MPLTGYLTTVAHVERKGIQEAVEDFLRADAPRIKASKGQPAQPSSKYAYNRELQLRKFAATFPGTADCDLTKEHPDQFMGALGDFSAKSRNHYRDTIRQLLQWSIRKDYLAPTHRLIEADTMRPERSNTAEVWFYAPAEFRALS